MKHKKISILIFIAIGLFSSIFFWWFGIFTYFHKKDSPALERPEANVQDKNAENPDYRWSCGSLHNHIMIFDDEKKNSKSLKEAIAASKELGMEFIMLSEKGPAYYENSRAWQNMISECDKNTAKDFVCLSGQENCTQEKANKKPRGHFVIIENKNYISELLEVSELFKNAHKQGSIVIVSHPFYKEDISDMYNYNKWDIIDWDAIEVLDGVVDEESNQKALARAYEFWNQGLKKSITAGADFKNHIANTDEILDQKEITKALSTGYTCLYMNNLNRDSIIDAIKNSHGYVSSGARIKEFSVNNAMMGQKIVIKKSDSLNVKISLKADAPINKVAFIQDGRILKKFESNGNMFDKNFLISAEKSAWYGLEVYAETGKKAIANAIWVEIMK